MSTGSEKFELRGSVEFSPNIPEETFVPGDYVDLHTRSAFMNQVIWRASLAGAIFRVVEAAYYRDSNEIIIEWQDARGNRLLHAAPIEHYQPAEIVDDLHRRSPKEWMTSLQPNAAADEIAALKARVERLEFVLEPFALMGADFKKRDAATDIAWFSSQTGGGVSVTVQDMLDAYEELKAKNAAPVKGD